jgi:hypothetical protein
VGVVLVGQDLLDQDSPPHQGVPAIADAGLGSHVC